MEWAVLVGVAFVLLGGLGAWVAAQKRRPGAEGFVLGMLFGPLGVLVEAMLPTGDRVPVSDAGEPSSKSPANWKAPLAAFLLIMLFAGGLVAVLLFITQT